MAESFYWRLWRYRRQPMTWRAFERFPKVADYKNEYGDGVARYTARPKQMPCYLSLDRHRPPEGEDEFSGGGETLETRLVGDDWPLVAEAWHGAMADEVPLRMWHDRPHERLAGRVIDDVVQGRDGRVLPESCRLTVVRGTREDDDGATVDCDVPAGAAEHQRQPRPAGDPDAEREVEVADELLAGERPVVGRQAAFAEVACGGVFGELVHVDDVGYRGGMMRDRRRGGDARAGHGPMMRLPARRR